MDWIDVLRFLTLFCAGISAGGWVLVLVAIAPAKRRFPPGPAVQLHQVTTEMIDRYMPPNTAIAVLAGVLVLILQRSAPPMATIATAVGAAAFLGAGIVSFTWNIPTNRKIATWSPDAVPEEYRPMQRRWDTSHTARTAFGLVGLVAYIVAALAR